MDNINEKKTAEEILDKISHTYHPEFNIRYVRQEAAVTSMHRFATQETAALREENERLKEALKEERNKAISECIKTLEDYPGTLDYWSGIRTALEKLKLNSQHNDNKNEKVS